MTALPNSVLLGEVLRHRKEFITIDDLGVYRRPRVQLHARGIVLRDSIPGALIKTKQQQVCRSGEFLVAEIDAKVGGFGIVPRDLNLDGAIVSSHYFLFTVDETRLDPRYLDFYSRTPSFREQVEAQGSTNYAAIRPADVLSYRMPLPPLAEQKQVVSRIEDVAARIEDAVATRLEAARATEALRRSYVERLFQDLAREFPTERLSALGNIFRGKSPIYRANTGIRVLNQKCVRWDRVDLLWAKEVAPEWSASLPVWARTQRGDVLVNSTGEGTIGRCCAVAESACGLAVDSHVLLVRPMPNRLDSGFLAAYLRSPTVQTTIDAAKGATTTKQTELGAGRLRVIYVPVPPLPEQRRIVADLAAFEAEVEMLTSLQAATGAELDALLPSILDRSFRGEA